MKKMLFALLLVPLSACFNADVTFTVEDEDNARMKAVLQMGPELYGMIAASGEDPCAEGVGEVQADGGFICTVEETDTIDNILAELTEGPEGGDDTSDSPMDVGEGFELERLENGNLKVAFDLGSMNEDMSEQGVDPQMMAGMMQAFAGREISITVAGPEVVETNGTLSEDGKSAAMTIPLTTMFAPENDLPESFFAVINPN